MKIPVMPCFTYLKSHRLFVILTTVFISFLFSATVTTPAQAQSSFFTDNEINSDRLARIDSAMMKFVEEERVAGAVGLVMRDGEIVYERAAGFIDRENNRPMPTDAIFRIASQSKAVTSVAIMMLVEEGVISLEDPASVWMPTFESTTVSVNTDSGFVTIPANRPITIKNLLTHTSGISYGGNPSTSARYQEDILGNEDAYGWYTAHMDEPICTLMDRLGELPFARQPGEAWVYGYSTDVLGCIVERASGIPFDQFLEDRITGPLGMNDTHFYLPGEDRDRLAVVYTPGRNGRVERAPEGPLGQGTYVDGPRRSFSGGAGLLSTARDYGRFLEMLRNGGSLDGVQILSPHSVALMATDHVGEIRGEDGLGFGLGFEITERFGARDFTSEGTFGWSGAYGTDYDIDPQEKLVLVLMVQVVPYFGRGIREAFRTAVYQSLVSE